MELHIAIFFPKLEISNLSNHITLLIEFIINIGVVYKSAKIHIITYKCYEEIFSTQKLLNVSNVIPHFILGSNDGVSGIDNVYFPFLNVFNKILEKYNHVLFMRYQVRVLEKIDDLEEIINVHDISIIKNKSDRIKNGMYIFSNKEYFTKMIHKIFENAIEKYLQDVSCCETSSDIQQDVSCCETSSDIQQDVSCCELNVLFNNIIQDIMPDVLTNCLQENSLLSLLDILGERISNFDEDKFKDEIRYQFINRITIYKNLDDVRVNELPFHTLLEDADFNIHNPEDKTQDIIYKQTFYIDSSGSRVFGENIKNYIFSYDRPAPNIVVESFKFLDKEFINHNRCLQLTKLLIEPINLYVKNKEIGSFDVDYTLNDVLLNIVKNNRENVNYMEIPTINYNCMNNYIIFYHKNDLSMLSNLLFNKKVLLTQLKKEYLPILDELKIDYRYWIYYSENPQVTEHVYNWCEEQDVSHCIHSKIHDVADIDNIDVSNMKYTGYIADMSLNIDYPKDTSGTMFSFTHNEKSIKYIHKMLHLKQSKYCVVTNPENETHRSHLLIECLANGSIPIVDNTICVDLFQEPLEEGKHYIVIKDDPDCDFRENINRNMQENKENEQHMFEEIKRYYEKYLHSSGIYMNLLETSIYDANCNL